MTGRNFRLTIAIGILLLAGSVIESAMAAQKLFRWVDKNGEVHYGDRVPPEEVKLDRDILNEYGVTVKSLPREMTKEEQVERQRKEAIELAEQKQLLAAKRRDVILLNTYLSINEIESLRNRHLRSKLTKLQKDASRFQPYNPDPNAPPINSRLARELSNTLNSILVYEQTLIDTREKQTELVVKFTNDIDRYRNLRGLN